jgi:hypothetical protein
MSVLCFSLQPLYAQEKKRVDRKKTEARESGGDFYRVIIENNLFRPLGWQRPNRNPEYALIATWIGTQGAVAKALVMERKSSELYYVARGEKVGDAIVENIAANQVSLKDSNDIVTLKAEAIQFLSSSSRSGERSGERGGSAERERNERGAQRGARRGAIGEDEALREWLRNASPEERRRKLEAIRRQRQGAGRRGGRGRNNDSGDKKDSKDEDEENWEEIKGK